MRFSRSVPAARRLGSNGLSLGAEQRAGVEGDHLICCWYPGDGPQSGVRWAYAPSAACTIWCTLNRFILLSFPYLRCFSRLPAGDQSGYWVPRFSPSPPSPQSRTSLPSVPPPCLACATSPPHLPPPSAVLDADVGVAVHRRRRRRAVHDVRAFQIETKRQVPAAAHERTPGRLNLI